MVERIAGDLGVAVPALVGDRTQIDRIDVAKYIGDGVGEPTLRDIIAELAKPGRDPRAEFAAPTFRDDVTYDGGLEGRDGLGRRRDERHGVRRVRRRGRAPGRAADSTSRSSSEAFVKDPSEVVKVGQKLTVRVIEVDTARKRIGLSARKPQQQQRNDARRRRRRKRFNSATRWVGSGRPSPVLRALMSASPRNGETASCERPGWRATRRCDFRRVRAPAPGIPASDAAASRLPLPRTARPRSGSTGIAGKLCGQDAKEPYSVQPVGFSAAGAPGDQDARRLDNVADHAVRGQVDATKIHPARPQSS